MANKKGEGVRGVLGDLVSREKERQEHPKQPAEIAPPQSPPVRLEEPEPVTHLGNAVEPSEAAIPATPPKKPTGIKGRPRGRKDAAPDSPRERTKVTLSIDEMLRDQFYRLAHAEMIQPGEFVERALRYYIQNHQK